jgi:hypothetical protein
MIELALPVIWGYRPGPQGPRIAAPAGAECQRKPEDLSD